MRSKSAVVGILPSVAQFLESIKKGRPALRATRETGRPPEGPVGAMVVVVGRAAGGGDGRSHGRPASRGHPGLRCRTRCDRRAPQPGRRGRTADAGGVQPSDGAGYRGQDAGRTRPARHRPPRGTRGRRRPRRARVRPGHLARLAGRRPAGFRAVADGPSRHRGQHRRRYLAGPERGAAGRPRGHADHRVAGGRDPDHGPAGDPGRGVGLQPGRRHQGRRRAGARPRRANRPYPRVLAGRRRPDLPQRTTPGLTRRPAR